MRPRRIGRSGLRLPPLVLSTSAWGRTVAPDDASDLLEHYLDAGGSALALAADEPAVREPDLLPRLLGELGTARPSLVVRSASSGDVTSRGAQLDAVERTLDALDVDHVEVWLAHGWDPATPPSETVRALAWIQEQGYARYVGVSGLDGWQLARAATLAETAGISLVADQIGYHLLDRGAEAHLVPAAEHLGVGLMAAAPLAHGVLAGRYRHHVPADSRGASDTDLVQPYLDQRGRSVVEALAIAADGLGASTAEAALAWVLDRSGVDAAVVSARTRSQLQGLLGALELTVPDQVRAALDDVSR